MPARPLATFATFALLALAGCGGDDAASATLAGPVEYVRSGGLAGETETLTIRPDGAGTFELDRGLDQPSKDFEISDEERERLAGLVQEADLASVQVEQSDPVPDAYVYSLSYDGRKVAWETDHEPEPLDELTDALSDLAEKYGRP
jgi:hypothetical protein